MKHFTYAERQRIEEMRLWRKSCREIAEQLGRDPTSVSREIRRNGKQSPYHADRAQLRYEKFLQGKKRKKLEQYAKLKEYVIQNIRKERSPKMTAGRLKKYEYRVLKAKVSHETIYQFIYSQEGRQPELPQHLYTRRGRRFSWMKRSKPLRIPERVSIHERSHRVNQRQELGDWESDLQVYPKRKPALSVEAERKSRYVSLHKVADKSAAQKLEAIEKTIDALPGSLFKTMTFDNGTENVQHVKLKEEYNIQTYFCDPYCSWQKGTVENMNKWIRWYLPRETDLNQVSDGEIQAIQDKLNDKPRKCLNYLTPKEVLLGGAFNT